MVKVILEYLVKANTEWKGLDENIEWVGSKAHGHAVEIIKN